MKKIIVMIALVSLILSACNSPEMSIKLVEKIPTDVRDSIDPNHPLQLVMDGEKGSYIIYHSYGDVKADFDKVGDLAQVKFKVFNTDTEIKKQYVYYLTIDEDIEVIEVLINDEPAQLDNISS